MLGKGKIAGSITTHNDIHGRTPMTRTICLTPFLESGKRLRPDLVEHLSESPPQAELPEPSEELTTGGVSISTLRQTWDSQTSPDTNSTTNIGGGTK